MSAKAGGEPGHSPGATAEAGTATPSAIAPAATTAAPPTSALLLTRATDGTLKPVPVVLPPGAADVARLYAGFIPRSGRAGTTLYALAGINQTQAVAIDASGEHVLAFITDPDMGLAVWPGTATEQPWLAWTSSPASQQTTQLVIARPDGTDRHVLYQDNINADQPSHVVALGWSFDGHTLYFSREPYGLGGYILFGGASSLYSFHLDDGVIKELVPFNLAGGAFICLDDLAPDAGHVAEHCGADRQPPLLPILDLATGTTTDIVPPPETAGFGALGGTRFSPDGLRVAYALARRNPDLELGWLAVSDGLVDGSHVVATSGEGDYFTVIGWLNTDTILFQSYGAQPRVWQVNADGSDLHQVGEGTFVGLLTP